MYVNVGRIGSDLELKYIGDKSTALCEFVMAFDYGWGDKKRTEWLKMQAWGKTAENLVKYCCKGKQLFVMAEPNTRSWDDDNGKKQYKTTWNIIQSKFVDKAEGTPQSGGGGDGFAPLEDDDELPF